MEVSIKAALADMQAGSDAFAPDCPTRVLLDHITSRWGILILVALSNGTMRWGELRRWARGISEKMLAQTLRTLEADGLVLREQRPVVPPHVDYSLTDRGRELSALLLPLMDWIVTIAPPQPAAAAPASMLDARLPGQRANAVHRGLEPGLAKRKGQPQMTVDPHVLAGRVAVEVGFEPTEGLPPHTLSRRAPSATRRLHRG